MLIPAPIFEESPAAELVVLTVDNQRFQRRLLATQLERLGAARVLEAGDGAEALCVIDAHPGQIALIITDIEMPNMDGLALLRRIGERLPQVPTVVLSGLDEQLLRSVEAMSHAFGVSVLAILSKPASEEALAAAIEHTRLVRSSQSGGPRCGWTTLRSRCGAMSSSPGSSRKCDSATACPAVPRC